MKVHEQSPDYIVEGDNKASFLFSYVRRESAQGYDCHYEEKNIDSGCGRLECHGSNGLAGMAPVIA